MAAGLVPSANLTQIAQEIIQNSGFSSLSSTQQSISLFTSEELTLLQQNLHDNYFTSQSLNIISKYLKSEKSKRSLASLIKGSSLKFPTFIKPVVEVAGRQIFSNLTQDTLEKKKRREYLLRKQQAREYNMMIHGSERFLSNHTSQLILVLESQIRVIRSHHH